MLGAIAFAIWWSILRPPAWWRAAGDVSPEAEIRGVEFENAMVREVTRVRDDPASWGFVVTDADVNAWLANRFEPWVASRGADEVLAVFGDPRVRLVPGGLEIGVAGPLGGVVVGRFAITLEQGGLECRPLGGRVGVLPIGASWLQDGLELLGPVLGDQDQAAVSIGDAGVLRLRPEIPLSDGRTVRLEDLEIVSGELGVRFRTVGP